MGKIRDAYGGSDVRTITYLTEFNLCYIIMLHYFTK